MNSTTTSSGRQNDCNSEPDERSSKATDFVVKRLWVIGIGTAIIVAPFIWRFSFPQGGPPICYLRSVIGLPCPGCGLTRAFCALAVLDWQGALRANAASFPLALCCLTALLVATIELIRGRCFAWYRSFFSLRIAKYAALALIGFHLVRLCSWCLDGSLVEEHLKSGLLYKFLVATRWFS